MKYPQMKLQMTRNAPAKLNRKTIEKVSASEF